MSIAITAPRKYDFQDLVCIKYILQFHNMSDIRFIVEPNEGEDAKLSYIKNNELFHIEIQVKGSEDNITLDKIAECLGHFPSRKDTNFLFERLILNENSLILLVMSGRANDCLQQYLPNGDWNGNTHSKNHFTQKHARAILESLKKYASSLPEKELNKKRKDHIYQFIRSLNLKKVKDSLCRLIIIENVTTTSLTDSCRRILRKDFYVPDDLFDNLLLRLATIIKDGKDSQANVYPLVLKKIDQMNITSICPQNYIIRGIEDTLISQLKINNVLLLSGIPRTGKSYTAKWIASKFQAQGYNIFLLHDVEEAERVLLDTSKSPRLVVIDDPLGGTHSINKPHEKLSILKRLITNLRHNRKLIISQGQEKLLEVMKVAKLSDANLDSYKWTNLSVASIEFSLQHWEFLQKKFSIPNDLSSLIHNKIKQGLFNIEPGCLVYLAGEHTKIDSNMSIEEILRFARREASDLSQILIGEGCRDILMALAITTNHLSQINEKELAFVLTNESHLSYGYSKIGFTAYNYSSSTKKHNFPEYQYTPKLLKKDQDSLSLLEYRQMIEFNENSSITFTHPFYRSVSEHILKPSYQNDFLEIKKILNNGLFCLSPYTSEASAKNIHWIYKLLTKDNHKNQITELAILGLDSSYPSVRDICFEFLIDILPLLDDKYKKEQTNWVHKVTGDKLHILEWNNDKPWYPIEDLAIQIGTSSTPNNEHITQLLHNLEYNTETQINSKNSHDILNYLYYKPEGLTHLIISKILSCNEGLIRALAVEVWMKINRNNDCQILERIFNDKHPAVAGSIFKSSIRHWNQFNSKRQKTILNGLKKLTSQPILAYIIIQDIIKFDRQEITGQTPPWEIFSVLLPIVLSSLPSGARFSSPRLYNVVNESIIHLKKQDLFSIIESWLKLLEKTSNSKILDDYELGITDILMKSTQHTDKKRICFIKRLLHLHGTAHLVRVIADLTNNWENLSTEEQCIITKILSENRQDKYWLKAAVLTSRTIPAQLRKIIIDKYSTEPLKATDILKLKPELLIPAFKMYIGSPQPLYYIGTHHREHEIWPNVIKLISQDPSHILFEVAFNELLSSNKQEILKEVITFLGDKHAEKMFKLLLQHFINSNPDFMTGVWYKLFSLSIEDKIRSSWIESIALNSLAIFDKLNQVNLIIPALYSNEFFSHFKNECFIINYLEDYLKMDEQPVKKTKNDLLNTVKCFLNDNQLRHYNVYDIIEDLLTELGYSHEDTQFIKNQRNILMEKIPKKNYDISEKITNWVF